jgi:hypothetical protein
LRPGQRLHWYQSGENEFRVIVETPEEAPGPLAALGYARRFHAGVVPTSDEAMSALREGED